MKILKTINIKQIITEKSKNKLYEKFQTDKEQLERECQQLLFEQRKLKNKFTSSDQEIKERFEAEIEQRNKKIGLIDFQIEQLDVLETGSEIVEKEVNGLIEVAVGDNWNEITAKQSIIVEDDIVIRIDNE